MRSVCQQMQQHTRMHDSCAECPLISKQSLSTKLQAKHLKSRIDEMTDQIVRDHRHASTL